MQCSYSECINDVLANRSLETSVCDIAVSLAQRYNVPLWEVYMTHLEFLFDSGYVFMTSLLTAYCMTRNHFLLFVYLRGQWISFVLMRLFTCQNNHRNYY